jgi:hypothetical protein
MQAQPLKPQGILDRLTGPGATVTELLLQFVPPVLGAVAAATYGIHLGWDPWQWGLAAFFAVDLVGGVITNATQSAKRWFHRPGQGFREHFGFVGLHLLHLAVVAWVFRGGDWIYVAITGSFLLSAAAAILTVPPTVQRPVAMGLYGLSLVGSLYGLEPVVGLEWFLPFFYLKVLVSHLVKEDSQFN